MIRRLIPWKYSSRVQMKLSESHYSAFLKMCQTAKFTGTVSPRGFSYYSGPTHTVFQSFDLGQVHPRDGNGRLLRAIWSPETIKTLQDLEIQIRNSEAFNKCAPLVPCYAKDDAPWFWRRGHMPQDWSWAWLSKMMYVRLVRIDEFCDKDNLDFNESQKNNIPPLPSGVV